MAGKTVKPSFFTKKVRFLGFLLIFYFFFVKKFLPRDAMLSAVFAVAGCMSVCLSVCLSRWCILNPHS